MFVANFVCNLENKYFDWEHPFRIISNFDLVYNKNLFSKKLYD